MLYALLFLCLAWAFVVYHVAGLTAVVKKLHDKLIEPAKPERPEPKYPLLVSELKEGVHYHCMLSDRLVCVKNIRLKDASTDHSSFADCAVYNATTGNYHRESFGDNDLYTTDINLAPRELEAQKKVMKRFMDFQQDDLRRQRERRQREEAAKAAARDYTAPTQEGGIPGLVEMDTPEPRIPAEPMAHTWDETGERCTVCGSKDWMSGGCIPPPTERNHPST